MNVRSMCLLDIPPLIIERRDSGLPSSRIEEMHR